MLRHAHAFAQPARTRAVGTLRANRDAQDQPTLEDNQLERDPDVDATVLRAGSAAILRSREKPVVAAGRSARMIVTVLRGLVAPIAALMIVAPRWSSRCVDWSLL